MTRTILAEILQGVAETSVDPKVYCNDCGALAPQDRTDGTRERCPDCGSTARQFRIAIESTVTVTSQLALKARHGQPGEVAAHLELKTGDSWSYRFAKWMTRRVRVDRENDRYEETVIDPDTGAVIHHDSGPLTEHTGHGSAKQKHLP